MQPTDTSFCRLVTTLGYAFAFTLPIVLRETLGFNMAQSQCLTAPPYFFSAIIMYTAAWLSDKYRQRGLVIVVLSIVSLIGLPIMGWAKNPWVRYFGIFIAVGGANSAIPSVMSYQVRIVDYRPIPTPPSSFRRSLRQN